MQISLYGKEFNISNRMIQEYHDLMEMADLAKKVTCAFLEEYDVCCTLSTAIERLPELKHKYYLGVAKHDLDVLRDADILGYDYTAEDYLAETGSRCVSLDNVYYDLLAAYKRLNHEQQAAERYRDMRKESRGRLIGGGFSISGALKGIAIAETFNILTGAAHSLYNMADGAFTDSDIAYRKGKIYENARNLAANAVFDDVIEMMYARYDRMGYTPLYSYDNRKAHNIKNAVDNGEVPSAKLPGQVAEVLYRMPYEDQLYFWAFDLLGDSNGELEQYAKLFGKEYVVATPKVFGKEYRKIYEKYGENPFFPHLIENPTLSLPAMFSQMYEEAVAGYKLPHCYLPTHSSFTRKCAEFQTVLKHYGYDLNETGKCFAVFNPDEKCCIALTETAFCTNNRLFLTPAWEKIDSLEVANNIIEISGSGALAVKADVKEACLFILMAQILLLKKKYGLGTRNNTKRLNAKTITDAKFAQELQKVMKLVQSKHPFSGSIYYIGEREEKFRNAQAEYVHFRKDEFPLLCYDATLLGGAEDGLIATTKGIHLHNMMEDAVYFPWEDLQIKVERNEKLYLNQKCVNTAGLRSSDFRSLVAVIRILQIKREVFNAFYDGFSAEACGPSALIEQCKENPSMLSGNYVCWYDEDDVTIHDKFAFIAGDSFSRQPSEFYVALLDVSEGEDGSVQFLLTTDRIMYCPVFASTETFLYRDIKNISLSANDKGQLAIALTVQSAQNQGRFIVAGKVELRKLHAPSHAKELYVLLKMCSNHFQLKRDGFIAAFTQL